MLDIVVQVYDEPEAEASRSVCTEVEAVLHDLRCFRRFCRHGGTFSLHVLPPVLHLCMPCRTSRYTDIYSIKMKVW
jgi:hypothetical protein